MKDLLFVSFFPELDLAKRGFADSMPKADESLMHRATGAGGRDSAPWVQCFER